MGGRCGTTAAGYTIHVLPDVTCPFAMEVAAQLHENPPASVTTYSAKLKKNVTVSCQEGVKADILCTTPSGGTIDASPRG